MASPTTGSPTTTPPAHSTTHSAHESELLPATLNPPQIEAVTTAEGPLLVLAGAGSGKTRVITYRIAHLLAMHHAAPYRIYAVTFTNKAAREMRSRIEQLVGQDLASSLWVGTFHATCARLLRRYHELVGLRRDFVIYDDADQRTLMKRVITDLDIDDKRFPPKLLLSILHDHKQLGTPIDELPADNTVNQTLREACLQYQRKLIAANAVDFDDLILHVMRIAEDASSPAGLELQRRFEHILVDEFQDVNQAQYRLVRALATNYRSICVVGDDDQSIYRWRGADVRIIRGFKHDFPNTRVVKLEQNYRSTANIVRGALAVIQPSSEREPKDLFTANADGTPIDIVFAQNERDEASYVSRSITEAIATGLSPQQIAIFYRVHAQSRVLEEALRNANIPYQIIGGIRFFDRKEIKDLLAYLRVLSNPDSDVDLLRIINTPPRHIGPATVDLLFDHATTAGHSAYDVITKHMFNVRMKPAQRKRVVAFASMMEELRKKAAELPPRALAEHTISVIGYEDSLLSDDTPESEARIQNLRELLGSISDYEKECVTAEREPSLAGYLESVSLESGVDNMKDVDRVSMMTVHAAKGLEFHTVFVTGFEEGLFPFRSSNDEIDVEEERRLAYVAFTRARTELTILHTGTRTLFGSPRYNSPSEFLCDLPASLTNHETTFGHTNMQHGHARTKPQYETRRPGERYVELDEPYS